MKLTRYILLIPLLSLLAAPVHAGGLAKGVSYIGAGTWFFGMTMGFIAKNKANRVYDEYIQAADAPAAEALWLDYESEVNNANGLLTVGFIGLGLSVTSFILGERMSGRRAALDSYYEGGQQKLAMLVKF
jgi:hypothetical protein